MLFTAVMAAALLVASTAAAQSLSDPTRRPDAAASLASASGQSGWQLQSTQVSGRGRSAVINGQIVREGQRIADARVLRIEHGQVILDVGGHRTTVSMFAPIGKTPVLKQGSQE